MDAAGAYSQLTKVLGKGVDSRVVLTSAVVVTISLFYVFAVGSYLGIGISYLVNRGTLFTSFDFHVINELVDNIIIASGTLVLLSLFFKGKFRIVVTVIYATAIAGAGFVSISLLNPIVLIPAPIVVYLVLFRKKSVLEEQNKVPDMITTLSKNYFALTIIALSVLSVIISFAPYTSLKINDSLTPTRDYAHNIFVLFSTYSPFILILLIACFPVKLLINELQSRKMKSIRKNTSSTSVEIRKSHPAAIVVYLTISMTLAALLVLIPHQPFINKDGQEIGIDTKYYVRWVNELTKSNNIQEFTQQAFVVQSNGDRPISLILLFALGKITSLSNLYITFEYVPVILGPILVLVIFFLTRELTSNDLSALMTAFLTAISFHVLIGIFGGFYANWIALIFGYLALLFLVRFLRSSGRLNLVVFSALMLLVLFSHLYTWTVLTIAISAFLIIMLKSKNYQRARILLLLVVISSLALIDISKMPLSGSAGGIERDLQVAGQTGSGFDQFASRWTNLERAVYLIVGGLFSNFMIFSLGLYWLYKSNWRDPSNILIMVFLSIGILPFLFGSGAVQMRVYYDIPFQIPAGIALALLMKNKDSLLSLSICAWLVAIAINSVVNFHSIPL